jgi:hypothetical protein
MARRTFTPTQVAEMLARWHRGDSTTDVAAAVGVDRKTVKKYADCALAAGIRPGGTPLSAADWTLLIARRHPVITQPRLRRTTWRELDQNREFITQLRAAGLPQERIWRRLRAERGVVSSLATLKRWVAENLSTPELADAVR